MSDPNSAPIEPVIDPEVLRARGVRAVLGDRPLVLEIGFGRADLIMALASDDPGRVYLGLDVARKRVLKGGRRIAREQITNAFLAHVTAEYMVERVLPPGSVDECWANFSDPWPKKRHFKRRLFQTVFIAKLAGTLRPGAHLHVATDHPGYALWIGERLAAAPGLDNLHAPDPWSDERPKRPITAYEALWLAEGRTIAYFDYCRK